MFALDGRPRNIAENPMAAMMYVASASIYTPNSLSQEVELALGAQAGEARLRKVFEDAGFAHFRRAAQTPMNLIIEARAWDVRRGRDSNNVPLHSKKRIR